MRCGDSERQQATLRAELERLPRLRAAGLIDLPRLRPAGAAVVADWHGLMGHQVSEGQTAAQGGSGGGMVFTPKADTAEVDLWEYRSGQEYIDPSRGVNGRTRAYYIYRAADTRPRHRG